MQHDSAMPVDLRLREIRADAGTAIRSVDDARHHASNNAPREAVRDLMAAVQALRRLQYALPEIIEELDRTARDGDENDVAAHRHGRRFTDRPSPRHPRTHETPAA